MVPILTHFLANKNKRYEIIYPKTKCCMEVTILTSGGLQLRMEFTPQRLARFYILMKSFIA